MKEKRSAQEDIFGAEMDYAGAALRGLVQYCVLLMTAFWGYQDGKGGFYPLLYLLILPWSLFCAWIRNRQEGKRRVLLSGTFFFCWLVLSAWVKAAPVMFGFMGLFCLAEPLFTEKRHGKEKSRQLRRFWTWKHYRSCGAAMWACSAAVLIESKEASARHPVSPGTCVSYMAAAFMAYLMLGVMLRYLHEEYQYFKVRTGVSRTAVLKVKKMNKTIAVLMLFCFGGMLFFVKEALVEFFSILLSGLFVFLVNIGLLAMNQISLSRLYEFLGIKMRASDAAAGSGAPGNLWQMGDSAKYLLMFAGAGIFLAAVWMLARNYRKSGAGYVLGEDKAVYIEPEGKTAGQTSGWAAKKIRFPDDHAGRVRKLYYQAVNQKMDYEQARRARKQTAREISAEYPAVEDMDGLTACYEKARYTNKCSVEDVKRAQELVKK